MNEGTWFLQNPGDTVRGRIIAFDEGQTRRGTARRALIEAADGERRWLWLAAPGLERQFAALDLRPSDEVAVVYGGRSQVTGRNLFDVRRLNPAGRKSRARARRAEREQPPLPGLPPAVRKPPRWKAPQWRGGDPFAD